MAIARNETRVRLRGRPQGHGDLVGLVAADLPGRRPRPHALRREVCRQVQVRPRRGLDAEEAWRNDLLENGVAEEKDEQLGVDIEVNKDFIILGAKGEM